MNRAGRSVLVFGLYLAVLGVVLVITPNFLLHLFGLPTAQEVWIRVVGVLLLAIALYDIEAARANIVPFFRWSVYARAPVVLFFVAFVLAGLVKPTLILFGLIDLAGAAWTWVALKSEVRQSG